MFPEAYTRGWRRLTLQVWTPVYPRAWSYLGISKDVFRFMDSIECFIFCGIWIGIRIVNE